MPKSTCKCLNALSPAGRTQKLDDASNMAAWLTSRNGHSICVVSQSQLRSRSKSIMLLLLLATDNTAAWSTKQFILALRLHKEPIVGLYDKATSQIRKLLFLWCFLYLYTLIPALDFKHVSTCVNNPFPLLLNLPQIKKLGSISNFGKFSGWPSWLLIDPL